MAAFLRNGTLRSRKYRNQIKTKISPKKFRGEFFVGVLEKPQGFWGWLSGSSRSRKASWGGSRACRRCPFGSVYSSKKEKIQILKPVICSRVFAIQPLTRCVLYDRMLIEESFLPHTKEIFSKKYHKIFRGFAFKVH